MSNVFPKEGNLCQKVGDTLFKRGICRGRLDTGAGLYLANLGGVKFREYGSVVWGLYVLCF